MDLVELRFAGDLSRRTDPTLLYYSYSDTNARIVIHYGFSELS